MYLSSYYLLGERHRMRNFTLSTVYERVLHKKLQNAHNALVDIDATKELLDTIVRDLRK